MFIVIEIQVNSEGQLAHIVTSYNNLPQAQQQFYTILAAAAVSSVPKHSAVILDQMGVLVARDGFQHPVTTPQIEEEPEE